MILIFFRETLQVKGETGQIDHNLKNINYGKINKLMTLNYRFYVLCS